MGLIVIYIGVSSFFEEVQILTVIISLVLGGIIGYLLKLDVFFRKVSKWLANLIFKSSDNNKFSIAFVNATVLFAAGSMSIIGAIEASSSYNNGILLAKTIIDGIKL